MQENIIESKGIGKKGRKADSLPLSDTSESLKEPIGNEANSRRGTAVPEEISSIPGLGPIRIRGLIKAGFDTLQSLKEVSIERLAKVPGLTEVKAKQIKDYLEQTEAKQVEVPILPERPSKKENSSTSVSPDQIPGERATRLVTGGAQALVEVINLLLTPQASDFRSRLLRDLSRFSQRTQSLIFDAAHLSPDNQERAIRRLRRATKELGDFAAQALTDRKMQSKLADSLEELCDKLAECALSINTDSEIEDA